MYNFKTIMKGRLILKESPVEYYPTTINKEADDSIFINDLDFNGVIRFETEKELMNYLSCHKDLLPENIDLDDIDIDEAEDVGHRHFRIQDMIRQVCKGVPSTSIWSHSLKNYLTNKNEWQATNFEWKKRLNDTAKIR